MNSFGERLRVSTFGESHGSGVGCVIDGFPSGVAVDLAFLARELERRKSGLNPYSTQRKEPDKLEILSGVFEGLTTGAPIGLFIANSDTKSADYAAIKDIFRPGHADFTYFHKYGLRDYRGGGRSSARETAARVAAGAFAKLLLREFGVKIKSGIFAIGGIEAAQIDFENALRSEIFALDKDREAAQKEAILAAKNVQNSVGGSALVVAENAPIGLGEPLYYKLDAAIGALMMGLNGVKALEIGAGFEAARTLGSQNNDPIGARGFASNKSGGILGGISNGENIVVRVHFKPTPSIFTPQNTINTQNEECQIALKGRHDPCIAVRGSVVAEALLALILADMLLLNASVKLENLKKIYPTK